MAKLGEHAVVLGASMAGLVAARALAEFFETVTVVERDALSDTADHRRGVPQGRQIHGLLLRGAQALERIAAVLSEMLAGLTRGLDNDALHQLQERIGAALVDLNAMGAEAERERAAHLSSGPYTGPLRRTILRLRHDLVMIGRATVTPLPPDLRSRLAAPLASVSAAIVNYLKETAVALRTGAGSAPARPVEAALQAYSAEVAALRSEGLTRSLPGDAAERFFAVGFSLEQIRQNLKDLDRCAAEWPRKAGKPDPRENIPLTPR